MSTESIEMAVGQNVIPQEQMVPAATDVAGYSPWTVIKAYVALTKPRIMSLLLFTTLAAALIAERQHPMATTTFMRILLGTMLGGALAAGGAAALNCYIDRDIDEVMARTRRRGIPARIVQPRSVLVFGLILSTASLVVLLALTNTLAAALALFGSLFYILIYTAWLKRATTQNIVIGGIAGAIPPLVGWAAVTGSLALPAFLLFVLITYWTPAHFWALALSLRRDYSRAAIPMLPSVTSQQHATWQILVYTLLVVISSLLLVSTRTMGVLYLAIALGLGIGLVFHALRVALSSSVIRHAYRMFTYSNFYLAALFAAMILDRLIR